MAVQQWAKDFMEEFNTEPNKINKPNNGQIVLFIPFHNSEHYKIGEIYKIEIINGQFWGNHGLSNFWYWYRLDENGNRVREEHGYGNFYTI
mgnify:CR=1 FL=1|jgi:hypothetical protein